jgi:hypothetical protein
MSGDLVVGVWMPPRPATLWLPGWRARLLLLEWAALPEPIETVLEGIASAAAPEKWDAAFQVRLPKTLLTQLNRAFVDPRVRAAWQAWTSEPLGRQQYGWFVGIVVWSAIHDPGGIEADAARQDWIEAFERDQERRRQLEARAAQPPQLPKPALEPLDDSDGIVYWQGKPYG